MPDAREGSGKAKQPRTIAGKSRPASNPVLQQSLTQYQNAMQLMQEGKFEKARALFEKLSQDGPPELLERSRVYLTVCSLMRKSRAWRLRPRRSSMTTPCRC